MGTQESLSLPDRFELPHPSFPYPGCFVRLLGPIILILLRTVDRLWYKLPMSNAITAQFIGNDLPGLASV